MKQLKGSALLLIEFQYEWLNPNGKLYHRMQDQASFLQSVEAAKRALFAARQARLPIFHSGLSFSPDYRELKSAKHGLRHTIPLRQTFLSSGPGCHFMPPFEAQQGECVVTGRTGSSAFAGSDLHEQLQKRQIDRLYMMGYALHVCVESSFRAAHDLSYEVILIEDASAAFTREQKEYVLSHVLAHFGEAISTQDFINQLKGEGCARH